MFFHISYAAPSGFKEVIEKGCQDLSTFNLPSGHRLVLLGDPVLRDPAISTGALIDADGRMMTNHLYKEIPGHYYWFLWKGDTLECGSAFAGILPVHFCEVNGVISIASSSFHLAREHGLHADDKQYLLERKLFNYPLFYRTPWKAVRLLPTNASLLINEGRAVVVRSFSVERYFGDGSRSDPADMHSLCRVFLEECDLQIPPDRFALSFTGGFDGRSLLGAALQLGRSGFVTYSFGRPGDSDLEFPRRQSEQLGLDHVPVELDVAYLENHAFRSALAFMDLSDYYGNLGRPHYHYAASMLSGSHDHLVTGNFGSELFRAMHNPGVMLSEMLIRSFSSEDGSWQQDLRDAAGPGYDEELASLIAELEEYLSSLAHLKPSARFYRFVYEEVFRKYFGPEIVVQSHFLRNRTPFLSLRFIEVLNGTTWSGVHSRLFERNKFRRIKGQAFYAAFLKATDRRLYGMPTNKGYGPADIAEFWRRPLLAFKMARKLISSRVEVDSNAVDEFYFTYHDDLIAEYTILDRPDLRPGQGKGTSECIRLMSIEAAWNKACAVNA